MKKILPLAIALILCTCAISAGCVSSPTTSAVQNHQWVNTNIPFNNSTVFVITDDFYGYTNAPTLGTQFELLNFISMAGSLMEKGSKSQNSMAYVLNEVENPSHEYEVAHAYAAGLSNYTIRNANGIEPLLPYVEEIKNINSLADLENYLKTGGKAHIYDAFVRYGVVQDIKTGKNTAISMVPAKLSLTNATDYALLKENSIEGAKAAARMENRSTFFSNMLKTCGFTNEEINRYIVALDSIESDLAPTIPPADLEAKNLKLYTETMFNPVTIDEMKKHPFPFDAVMNDFINEGITTYYIGPTETVEVLDKHYTEQNLDEFKAVLLYNLMLRSAQYLDANTSKNLSILKYGSENMGWAANMEISMADCNDILGMAVGKVIADQKYPAETKAEVTELTRKILDEYHFIIQNSTWMSDETKKNAIKKLDTMKVRVSYPDNWDYYNYDDVKVTEGMPLLDLVMDLHRHKHLQQLKDAVHENQTEVWPIVTQENVYVVPHTFNAFYNPNDNSINILGAYIAENYNSSEPTEKNLATLGTVIGHEISHAFDNSGALFDEYGAYRNWWTENDLKEFNKRTEKVAKYLDGFETLPGVYLNGKQYVGETLADMGGIAVILDAVNNINGFDYDKFFTEYAKLYESIYSEELFRNQIIPDVHLPGYYRVNVGVQQFDEFLNTYGVKPGDGMYLAPDNRIALW